jgi:hypothetical protein
VSLRQVRERKRERERERELDKGATVLQLMSSRSAVVVIRKQGSKEARSGGCAVNVTTDRVEVMVNR